MDYRRKWVFNMFCNGCGKQISSDQSFCPCCGARIQGDIPINNNVNFINTANNLVSYDDKYENISDLNTITISKTKLENMGYIENINFRDCKGYVLSSIINGKFNSDAYLSCDGYKTIGFERGLDNE